jgi:Na+-translocating ferredoxin:NAD+ oxidoreductase subunit B
MAVMYAVTRGCTKCGWCVHECQAGAITFDREGAHIDAEKCTGCGRCYDNCAFEAIERIEVTDK